MIELQQHIGKLKIENYGLWEFLQDFQQGVSQGYELDDSNEGFPQVYGSLYTCLLKPKKQEDNGENLRVIIEDTKPFATGGLIPDAHKLVGEKPSEQRVYPAVSPDTPAMTAKLAEDVAPTEDVVVKQEIDQPSKRGPKPKN